MQTPPDQPETAAKASTSQVADDRAEHNGDSDTQSLATRSSERDWSTLSQMLLLTALGALLMVSCVTFVNRFTAHRKEENILEKAAIIAAHELAEITIQHNNFGDVGLCDLPADALSRRSGGKIRAISIDRLNETLNIDLDIANKLNHPLIQKLVKSDMSVARELQQELSQRLHLSIEPDSSQTNIAVPSTKLAAEEQDNSVFKDVYRLLLQDRRARDASAVELKITLGRAKSAILTRDCDSHLVDPANFEPVKDDTAPYLVLIEAEYEKHGKADQREKLPSACALISAPNVEPPPSAFAITFPYGIPPQFRSAHDILTYKNWDSNGDWQQAVGSDVPGKGSLAPPLGAVMPSMSPGDAMAVALYHWLKSAGPSVDAGRAIELISSGWNIDPLRTGAHRGEIESLDLWQQQQVNSCLAKDTGSREYSIMNQTAPGTTGQAGLSKAFSIFDQVNAAANHSNFPPSALPLVVDENGQCNLSGRKGFDEKLAKDFLVELHDTNIAAIVSRAVAKQVVDATTTSLFQLDQKIIIEKQELASINSRMLVFRAAKLGANNVEAEKTKARSIDLAQQRIATLNSIIAADENQKIRYQHVNRLASLANAVGTKVADSTFELGSHVFDLCKDGIYRVDAPTKGFLVGKKYLFIPHPVPLTESDFLQYEETPQQASSASSNNDKPEPICPWFDKSLEAIISLDPNTIAANSSLKVEGAPLERALQNNPIERSSKPGMIILDSRSLAQSSNGAPRATAYPDYVFSNIPIPPGELLYYCQNAAETGKNPKVSWSVLLRDLVASKGVGTGDESVGNPILSQQRQWCHNKDDAECPGLSCEFQVRGPLPVLDKSFVDSYLKNAKMDNQVPQIPPVPPDML